MRHRRQNIGLTATLAAKVVQGARVVAVQPSPRAFACLQATIRENKLSNVIALHSCAVAHSGPVRFEESNVFLAGAHIAAQGNVYRDGGA